MVESPDSALFCSDFGDFFEDLGEGLGDLEEDVEAVEGARLLLTNLKPFIGDRATGSPSLFFFFDGLVEGGGIKCEVSEPLGLSFWALFRSVSSCLGKG